MRRYRKDYNRRGNATFNFLKNTYGASAATTYVWLRSQGQAAVFAHRVMLEQFKTLGQYYVGGLDCAPYRKMREGRGKMDSLVKHKLLTALVEYDKKQSKRKDYNRNALGIYMKMLSQVEIEVDAGGSVARALYDNFSDRALAALEKAVELPLTYGGGGQDKGRPA